jgi:zinc transport system substrate-binding protein
MRGRRLSRRLRAIADAAGLLAAVLAGAGACGGRPAPPEAGAGRPLVVATFYPLYEFARQVAGEDADVVSLVPPGVEPHDWEPSPRDLTTLRRARLLVYNGAGLEPWVERVLREAASSQLVPVNTTEGLPLAASPGAADAGHPASAGSDAAGAQPADPHVWLDPLLAVAQVEAIRTALQRVDPSHAPRYEVNAAAFIARLRALHAAYLEGLRQCARREVVSAHAAFGYLTRRYALTQVPLLGASADHEPSPADLARLVRLARRRQVRYVFAETILDRRLVDTLAREVGAKVLVLNPLEGLTPEDAAAGRGYLQVMEENLRVLRLGLDCR